MSRYIDADALVIDYYDDYETKDDEYTYAYVSKSQIDNAPSIDIVRCKECKNREKYPCGDIEFYECSHLRLYGTKVGVEDDWFCADGERKESE